MRLKHIRSSLNGYTDALNYFEGCTPWRSKPNDPRPLQERRNKIMSVRRETNGDIAFRYHSTDVVIWHSDNTFTVNTYASQSTDVFANGFTPAAFWSHMASDFVRIMTPEGTKFYRTRQQMRFELLPGGSMIMHTPPLPFVKHRIDRGVIKQVRQETGFTDFKLWATAYEAMVQPARNIRRWQLPCHNWTHAIVMDMLSDKDRWLDLTMGFASVDDCLNALDRSLKITNDVSYEEEVPFCTEWAEIEAIKRSRKAVFS